MTAHSWLDKLNEALDAIPSEVDVKAIRKAVNARLKPRLPGTTVSPHTQFITLWCEAYKAKFGFNYVFMAKDAMAVKKLLETFTVEHLMRIGKAAWHHSDSYPCSSAASLTGLLSKINEIRKWLNENHKNGGKGVNGAKVPAFKQLEILRKAKGAHPCNPSSIHYDETKCTPENRKDYADIKRRIMELEQGQRQQALA